MNIIMDQRGGGGCCVLKYAGGAYDASKVDMIMLRFRPIAPKPATTNGSPSAGAGAASPGNGEPSVKSGCCKRKRAAKDGKVNSCGGRRRKGSTDNTGGAKSVSVKQKVVETLPLLPETPDVKESKNTLLRGGFPLWLSFGGGGHVETGMCHVGSEDSNPVVVRVECVTEVDGYGWYGLGRTDEDRVISLDADTCPGFVSDGRNNVRWTNSAWRRMVGVGEEERVVSRVVVVDEEAALPTGCAAFTCRVRVVTCGKEKRCRTLPCDVWRMDCGGFAWRLDTTAALSLGR